MIEEQTEAADTSADWMSVASLQALRVHYLSAKEAVEQATADMKLVEAELARRFAAQVEAKLQLAGKAAGSSTIEADGIKLKGELPKKVEWDSTTLLLIAQSMPWDAVQRVFKIAFSVQEKIWDGIQAADPELAKKLAAARTVKYDPVKVRFDVQ